MTREEFISFASAGQESLRRFALCNGDAATADDIAQEALVNAYVASSSFRGTSRFETWLFRIAYNCFIDRLRRRQIRTESLNSSLTQTVPAAEEADQAFRHEDLYRALFRLPDKERATLLLFYMEDRPVREISAILGIPAARLCGPFSPSVCR